MTQALQQSIKLLQMNAQELQSYIENELEKNPFLQPGEEEASAEREQSGEEESTAEDAPAEPMENWESADAADSGDDWEYTPAERMQISPRSEGGEDADFQDTKAEDITLRQHLMNQAYVEIADPIEQRIAQHLIDMVDEAGYIRDDLKALSAQLGVEAALIERVLAKLQKLDPIGVCARDLRECLALQLKDKDRLDPAMETLLDNLSLLASAQLDVLRRKCSVDEEDLRAMIAEIRALNPKPGLPFLHEIVQPVEPDVLMKKEQGRWHIELNSSTLPKVLVNRRYYAKVSVSAKGADRKYMSEHMNAANWLLKALDQRANTILKVATDIVAQQDGFFRLGIHHLKPLTLKDIAAATGFHESTVSRVTTGKYIMTPRGLYELKYFFTSGLNHAAGGDDVSSETVRHLIKELIDKESPKNILSDDDIAEVLKARNINVARRTVAKYREGMHIPSSTQRRRLKLVAS